MTYVMSDLHGELDKFNEMLGKISFCDDDFLYIVGDIVDYGEKSIELLTDISMRYNVYAVVGEHDFKALRMLSKFDKILKSGKAPDPKFVSEMTEWAGEGGQVTLEGFRKLDDDMKEGVLDFLSEMSLYEETEVGGKKYVMVHCGIKDFSKDISLEDCEPETFLSEDADLSGEYFPDATLIVGHQPTGEFDGGIGKIYRGKNVIDLDCGAAFGGSLGCLCLDNGKEYYV